jgi:hypothetical protein
MTVIGSATVRLVHRVALRHATTGEPLHPLRAYADALPHGWWFRVLGGDVLVVRREGAPVPAAPPAITVSVADPRLAAVLQVPSHEVTLTVADVTVDVAPVPMTLTVELETAATGGPRTGRTVTARAGSGDAPRPIISLDEVTDGRYVSDPVVWTADLVPFDLLIDGELLRRTTVDLMRTETRVRLVDTT